MTMGRTTESSLVRALLDWLAFQRIFAWRNQTTGTYDPTRKKFRTFQGLKGVSDILGVLTLPSSDGPLPLGRFLAVEAKRRGEKLRPDQEEFLKNVRDRGGVGIVAFGIDDLERELKEYLA